MKKVFFSLFFILCALFIFSAVKVSATDTGVVTITNGASVRTENPSGLRFEATVSGEFEGSSISYGFVLTRGTFTKDQVLALAENKKVEVDCGEPDGEGKYNVTITNIPEEGYTGPVTALAYVKVDGVNRYSSAAVTRNIAETSFVAKRCGQDGTIINDVVDYINDHYMTKCVNNSNEFAITSHAVCYNNLPLLWEDFIADYNAATGATLTTSSTLAAFHTSFATGIASNSVRTFPSDCNAVKFFSGTNMIKWGWILDYFKAHGATVHVTNQATGLSREDRTCQSYDGHRLRHLGASIYNLFTEGNGMVDGMASNDFTGGASKYSNVTWPSVLDFKKSRTVEINETINLPAAIAPASGYTWDCYKLADDEYAGGAGYKVTSSNAIFKPTFSLNTYTITYHLDDGSNGVGNPATYNVETATINLAEASKAGYVFAGWYGNGSFTGDPITAIANGSTGNKELYAKFIREVSYVNPAWAGTTPGETVHYDDHDYTFGTDAFATVKAAVEAAAVGEQIYVLAGTYSDAFTIDKNYVCLIGPNNNVAGNSNSRVSPATITGQITLAKAVTHISICGFDFTGDAKIINTIGDTGTANATATNVNGFNFSYNKVQSGLTSGKGFIYFVEAASSYSHDLVFDYNYFAHAAGGATTALVYLDNLYNLQAEYNVFANITGSGLYVNDQTKGASGQVISICNNTFNTISVDAVHLNYISYLPLNTTTATIDVNENSFTNITGMAVYFGSCNNTDTGYAHVCVNNNTFSGTIGTCVKMNRVVSANVFKVNSNTFNSVPTSGKYVVNGMTATTNKNIDATGNTYATAPSDSNFSSGVTH